MAVSVWKLSKIAHARPSNARAERKRLPHDMQLLVTTGVVVILTTDFCWSHIRRLTLSEAKILSNIKILPIAVLLVCVGLSGLTIDRLCLLCATKSNSAQAQSKSGQPALAYTPREFALARQTLAEGLRKLYEFKPGWWLQLLRINPGWLHLHEARMRPRPLYDSVRPKPLLPLSRRCARARSAHCKSRRRPSLAQPSTPQALRIHSHCSKYPATGAIQEDGYLHSKSAAGAALHR